MEDESVRNYKHNLVIKFVDHLHKSSVFDNESCSDMLIEGINYEVNREFYKFIGIERVPLHIYETINKEKFIELAVGYYYCSFEN